MPKNVARIMTARPYSPSDSFLRQRWYHQLAAPSPPLRGRRTDGDGDQYRERTPKRSPTSWIVGNCNGRRPQENDDGASHHAEDSGTRSPHAGQYCHNDIDLVVNKTLVFAYLAFFVTVTYVLIVAGIGAIIGSAGQSNLPLSILATAVVALAFQPVRERAQALANRLVYGRRSDPHELLSRLAGMVAESSSSEQVLSRMLQLVVEATGAPGAAIYLKVGADRVMTARWPDGTGDLTGRAFQIKHQGQEMGQLVVAEPSEPLTGRAERLLLDVAGQAGLLVRNLRLTAELHARVEELAESRLRIVAAQDVERRRLERDIHDGIQQHVVALMAKVRLARNQVRRESALSAETLDEVQADAGRLLDEMREFASGIHPTVLTDGGVVAAVRFRADRLPIKVVLDADPATRTRRYPEPVEAAGYFIACEALANVLKHAGASRATVKIAADNGTLMIRVTDDGGGFDPSTAVRSGLRGLQDRVDAHRCFLVWVVGWGRSFSSPISITLG